MQEFIKQKAMISQIQIKVNLFLFLLPFLVINVELSTGQSFLFSEYDVTDEKQFNESLKYYQTFHKLQNPDKRNSSSSEIGYIILTSSVIQPDSIYSAVVTLQNEAPAAKLDVRLSLFKNGADIQGTSKIIDRGSTDILKISVPSRLVPGNYKIRVEGNYIGTQGGSVFFSESTLRFSPKFLAIMIQTNRYLYNGGQTVLFRVILLKRNLLPFDEPVEVFMKDSRGFIMRRWLSVFTNQGVADLSYELPDYPDMGIWTISVRVGSQIEEKHIQVEKYFQGLHEVFVSVPPYVLSTEREIKTTVSSYYGSEKIVRGNGTARLYGSFYNTDQRYSRQTQINRILIDAKKFFLIEEEEISWGMTQILDTMGSLDNLELRIEADVTEYFIDEMRHGFAETRLINEKIQVKFIQNAPLIFKPGMPFECTVSVSYDDMERVPRNVLENSKLVVTPIATLAGGGVVELQKTVVVPRPYNWEWSFDQEDDFNRLDNAINFDFPDQEKYSKTRYETNFLKRFVRERNSEGYLQDGVISVKFRVPKRTLQLQLRAEYIDLDGAQSSKQITVYSHYSPNNRYISVEKTGNEISIDGFAVMRVTSNMMISSFNYIVVAKGIICQYGVEHVELGWGLPKSFAITVSSEMAPGFTVLVYYGENIGEIVSDSVFVPVDKINRHKVSMSLSQNKDRSKDSVELSLFGDATAYFGISSQRTVRVAMQTGNDLTKAEVLSSLFLLEPKNSSIHKNVWRSRSGEESDEVQYFSSMNYGTDSLTTFREASIMVFTDGHVSSLRDPNTTYQCPEMSCVIRGCFRVTERCDGIQNCEDLTDELNCDNKNEESFRYRVKRISRFMDLYDPGTGDWAWDKINLAHSGDYYLTAEIPETTDDWVINGFAVSQTNGLSIVDAPLRYSSSRPFMMVLDAPPTIRRGEQVGIIAMMYNKQPKEILVMITLHDSPDYEFVHVGYQGLFYFYDNAPRFSSGDHQHLIWMPPSSEKEVRLPIRAKIDQGTIEVKVTAISQIRSDTESVEIEVLAEGVQIGKHTSLLLDLRSRAIVLKYFNVWVEDTPIIPYEIQRKYIYGSTAGHVTVSGDVVGPIVSLLPLTMEKLLGKEGKGTADRVFELAANVWTLHYMRLTNQLEVSVARKTFNAMNRIFAQIMRRFREVYEYDEQNFIEPIIGNDNRSDQGHFKMWDDSPSGNVWLTSWALQTFAQGSFQDWENYFYIDPNIFSKACKWLLKFQERDGSFSETYHYQRNPLNKRMSLYRNTFSTGNVTLTAHLVITLQNAFPFLNGPIQIDANIAKSKAIRYLEINLDDIKDPYSLAICTYALTITDSTKKDDAYGLLYQQRREDGEFIYWSPGHVPINEFVYENQRPFLQPKNNEFWDAMAVETTSYVLLTTLMREGIMLDSERMVSWLHTMRLTDGGFIGSIDTSIALQALTEFANIARVRELTDLKVYIELSADSQEEVEPIVFKPSSSSNTEEIEMKNVWGHTNIIGKGAGQAVVQLDLTYGIDWEAFKDTPPVDAFELTIKEKFYDKRNRSILNIESCFRWTLLTESASSGAAVLEVEIPSGYGLLQSDAEKLVSQGLHPQIKDVISTYGVTSWFFEYIPSNWTCFNYTVRRWYPVANLTSHKQATLYEAYAPERFVNTMYNDTSLRTIDICHVCGSYQCPYCPFYSKSTQRSPSVFVIALTLCIYTLFTVHFPFKSSLFTQFLDVG